MLQSNEFKKEIVLKKAQVKIIPSRTHEMPTETQETEKRTLHLYAKNKNLTLLPDRLAQDGFWVRNQAIPKGKELFPLEWRMQYVDVFYPHAKGGPLYIDQPNNDWEVAMCKRKYEVLRKLNIRYVYMTSTCSENEAMALLEGDL